MTRPQLVELYIDPPSHHFYRDKLFDAGAARYGGDQLLAPYTYLREFLARHGISVRTADNMPSDPPDMNTRRIYVSMGITDNYRAVAQRGGVCLSAFFAFECPIVEPSLYRELNTAQRYFQRIFTWSDCASLERFVGNSLRCTTFRWPQSFDNVHPEIWNRKDRQFLVMMNSNKLPRIYWQELYTERMRAVEYFSRTGEIDLYGVGWNRPSRRVGKTWMPFLFRRIGFNLIEQWQRIRPDPRLVAARRVYKGAVENKAETVGQYRFAICFENMILKGWITEKIFDCFFAGTIPVYWGAPDVQEHIPPECFIDMRQFRDYGELRTYLKSLSSPQIEDYRERARAFINSPQFYPFSKEAFAQLFLRIIEEDAGVTLLQRHS